MAEVAAIVDRIAADPGLLRVDGLAATLGTGTRRLQRIFAEYVGVAPKWVIRRYRMQEAADRAEAGTGVDGAAPGAELGYADQGRLHPRLHQGDRDPPWLDTLGTADGTGEGPAGPHIA